MPEQLPPRIQGQAPFLRSLQVPVVPNDAATLSIAELALETPEQQASRFQAGVARTGGNPNQRPEQTAFEELQVLPFGISHAFWLLDLPARAARGAFLEGRHGDGVLTGLLRGISGEEGYHFDEWYGRGFVPAASELLLDPLIVLGGPGLTAKGASAAKRLPAVSGRSALAGKAAVVRFGFGRGASISDALIKAGEATGFSGLIRLAKLERKAEAALIESVRTPKRFIFNTSIGEKQRILRDSAKAFDMHLSMSSVKGGNLSPSSFFRDLRRSVDRRAESQAARRLARSVLLTGRVQGREYADQIADGMQETFRRVWGDTYPDHDLAEHVLKARGQEFYERQVDLIEEFGRVKEADQPGFLEKLHPKERYTVRMVNALMDEAAATEALAGALSPKLGDQARKRIATVLPQIEGTEELHEIIRDGLPRLKGKGTKGRSAEAQEAARAAHAELDALLSKGGFISKDEKRMLKRWATANERATQAIDDFFLQRKSALNAELMDATRVVDGTPGYLKFYLTKGGAKYFGIEEKFTNQGRTGIRVTLSAEEQLKRESVWSEFNRDEIVAGLYGGDASKAQPIGVSLTHREANWAAQNGVLNERMAGIKAEGNIFGIDPIKAVHSRLITNGRLVSEMNLLRAAKRKFGRVAQTSEEMDALKAQGLTTARDLGFFTNTDLFENVLFEPETIRNLAGVVDFMNPREQNGFMRMFDGVTRIWRDFALFGLWRAAAFNSRNTIGEGMFNWFAGVRGRRGARSYLGALKDMTRDGGWYRQAGEKFRGKRAPIRVGALSHEITHHQDIESWHRLLDEEDFQRPIGEVIQTGAYGRINSQEIYSAYRHNLGGRGFFASQIGDSPGMKRRGPKPMNPQESQAMIARAMVDEAMEAQPEGIMRKSLALAKKASQTRAGKALNPAAPDAYSKQISGFIEEWMRYTQFRHEVVENGLTFEAAAERVRLFHSTFDGALGPLETNLRRAFPFWNWIRFNIPAQARFLMESPYQFAATGRVAEYIARGVDVEENDLPEWATLQGAVPMKRFRDPDTGVEYYGVRWLGNNIPLADWFKLTTPEGMWRWLIDNVNAPARAVTEALWNYDLAYNRPLSEDVILGGGSYAVDIQFAPIASRAKHVLETFMGLNLIDRALYGLPSPEAETIVNRPLADKLLSQVFPFAQSRFEVGREQMSQAIIRAMMVRELKAKRTRVGRSAFRTPEAAEKQMNQIDALIEEIEDLFARGEKLRFGPFGQTGVFGLLLPKKGE